MAGDGTVMWVVQEAELHHINPQRMHIGMVPLGTGSMWDGWADYLASSSCKVYCCGQGMIFRDRWVGVVGPLARMVQLRADMTYGQLVQLVPRFSLSKES